MVLPIAFTFLVLEQPFDTHVNGLPLFALCRTIEIDLRQRPGKRDVPAPAAPVDGALL